MARPSKRSQPARPHQDQPLIVVAARNWEHFSPEVGRALLEEAALRGWRLVDLTLTDGFLPPEQSPAGAIVNWLPTDPPVVHLRQMGCPVVRLGRLEHPDDHQVPVILPDYPQIGRMVARHFADRGFRDIVLVGYQSALVVPLIDQGLRPLATELGCTCHLYEFGQKDIPPRNDPARARLHDQRARELTTWLKSLPKPLALLVCHDFLGAQVCMMCLRAGYAVPEEIAILTYASSAAQYAMAPVPLSAIALDQPLMARTAIQRLDDLLHGRPGPERTVVAPQEIVPRRSTDILAVDHPLVARTVRFLWDYLDQDLSVD